MTDQDIVVTAAKDVEDLIPTFMGNRKKEVELLRELLGSGNLEQIGQIGHRMVGVGAPYGFDAVSALGKGIEDGAKAGDRVSVEKLIAEYTDYITRVRVVFR